MQLKLCNYDTAVQVWLSGDVAIISLVSSKFGYKSE